MTFELIPFLASYINGASFGSLIFVGAVDARTFCSLASANHEEVLKKLFPVWWPYGRDLMLPIGVIGIALNSVAYTTAKKGNDTKWYWLVPAAMHATISVWTGLVMGNNIRTLLEGEQAKNFIPVLNTFCLQHLPRIVFSGVGFAFSTLALMNGSSNNMNISI